MNHASAGNSPALPPDPHTYFRTPEFYARIRNVNEAMQLGMTQTLANLPEVLGCTEDELTDYLASVSDANGLALVDVGGGEYMNWEMGTDDVLSKVVNAATGADDDAALGAIFNRLLFLRTFCDHRREMHGIVTEHFALNGLLLTFTGMGGRFWPAVQAYWNRRYGLSNVQVFQPDGEENLNELR